MDGIEAAFKLVKKNMAVFGHGEKGIPACLRTIAVFLREWSLWGQFLLGEKLNRSYHTVSFVCFWTAHLFQSFFCVGRTLWLESLPHPVVSLQVGNLGLLFMLLFFIFAALGVELFGDLSKETCSMRAGKRDNDLNMFFPVRPCMLQVFKRLISGFKLTYLT